MIDRLAESGSGCFVRCVGVSDSYLLDIEELDRRFEGEGYLRLNKLDTPTNSDELERLRKESEEFAESFEGARLLALYRESVSNLNPSIETNLITSLLYWSKLLGSRTGGVLIYCGKAGYKEYLFCYLAYMKGWRVLMLMPEGEGKLSSVLIEKSELITLGMPYAVQIPAYVPPRPVTPPPVRQPAPRTYPSTPQADNTRYGTPSREQRNGPRPNAPMRGDEGNIRVTIPPRERRNGPRPNAPMRGDEGNIKVKIPPRQRTKGSTNVPKQTFTASVPEDIPFETHSDIPPVEDNFTPYPKKGPTPPPPQRKPSTPTPMNRSTPAPVYQDRQRRELSSEEIARLAESVVMITVCNKFGDMIGSGSGIVINADGYILTNHHVVSKGTYFLVRFENDATAYPVQIVKYNNVHDMALLKIQRRAKPLMLYRNMRQELVRGQKVIAIGSPLGLFNTVSDGIISGFRVIDVTDMIQFTAPISPGSSGGALLNTYGEIIGMCTGGAKEGQNINLAVSCRIIEPFIMNFI
jgi:hypothetical protein